MITIDSSKLAPGTNVTGTMDGLIAHATSDEFAEDLKAKGIAVDEVKIQKISNASSPPPPSPPPKKLYPSPPVAPPPPSRPRKEVADYDSASSRNCDSCLGSIFIVALANVLLIIVC